MRSTSLGDKLLNWFGSDDEALAVPKRPVPVEEPCEPSDAERGRVFEQQLKALLTQPMLLAAGRVHMINLATLRERLGNAWPDLRNRVHTAADRILKRHLSNRDVHFRTVDDEYIIVFATLSKEAATLVCAKIAEELHRFFLGDPDLQEVKIATAVGAVDGKVLYEQMSVAGLLLGFGKSAAATGTDAGGAEPTPAPAARPADANAAMGDEPRRLKLASGVLDQVTTMFRPVWDVERQVISTYLCTPVRRFPDGSCVEGVAALAAISDAQHLARINSDAFIDTVEVLDELFRNKFRLMVSVPVCFETLAARRTRQEYIATCQSMPDYLRPFITFELLRFPAGVPNGRLTELVNELRPFCRWVILRTDMKQPSFANLVGTGLTGVSATVSPDRNAEARTMEELNSFVAAAERAHLRTCAVGITTTSLAIAARAAGVTFIAGDRIGRAEEIPQHMLRFGWQDLFHRTGSL